ncbi:MAG TPA: SRPBCC family protein [Candidatus Binatia bacterium]|nr:SRPBCC family protein [Candidatus Binatia bacterium]
MWFELRKENLDFISTAPVVHTNGIEIAVPLAGVFSALTNPATWSEWFPSVRWASYPSAPPHGVGTIREAHVGSTRWVEQIIAWDVDARWAYTVLRSSVPFAHAQVESFELTDQVGRTHIRWTLALEPRLLARLGAPFAPRAITRVFQRAMANLELYLRQRAATA